MERFFILNRSGDFNIQVSGNSHCGVVQTLNVKYHVKAECAQKLDKRGFLFDQLTVDNFFKSKRQTKLSCEQLSVAYSKELTRLIKRENPDCKIKNLEVTLSPAPYAASMTYCCREK